MTATAAPTTNCLRCGRALTSAKSIAAGYGRGCARKIRANTETLGAQFTDRQIEDAVELVEDGGVIPTDSPLTFLTVSGDGEETYMTTTYSCTCPRGEHGRACYHQAAVLAVVGTQPELTTERRYVTAA